MSFLQELIVPHFVNPQLMPKCLAKYLFLELICDWCAGAKCAQNYVTRISLLFQKSLFFQIFWAFKGTTNSPLLLAADVGLQPGYYLGCSSWVRALDPGKKQMLMCQAEYRRFASFRDSSPLPFPSVKKIEGLRAIRCRNTGVVLARTTEGLLLLVTHLVGRLLSYQSIPAQNYTTFCFSFLHSRETILTWLLIWFTRSSLSWLPTCSSFFSFSFSWILSAG